MNDLATSAPCLFGLWVESGSEHALAITVPCLFGLWATSANLRAFLVLKIFWSSPACLRWLVGFNLGRSDC